MAEGSDPIAVVGLACRLPKAKSAREFWTNLQNGVDCISKVPPHRWNADAFYDPDADKPGKMPTTQGGFLDDIDKFDASFFRLSAREVEVMDPQQRLLLEVSYEALEDAGIPVEQIRGTKTGVFSGTCFSDYHKLQVADVNAIRPYVQTGCAHSIVPNRLSFFYDLRGPSLSVDTACSSSLVALHLACQSLKRGEVNAAVVTGTSANLLPEMFIAFSKLHMLSPAGRCKSFDASGDGYVRSEGICVLVVKRLSDAIKSGDSIRAIIRGTGVNQDGNKSGLTYPSTHVQAQLLEEVYAANSLTPDDVQFIEAHGTGTKVGDPVETGAIGRVLGATRKDGKLLIGSVKSNIGHLEGASGLAGVIKTVLSIERGVIPTNLHFTTPNPEIDFDGYKLEVVDRQRDWPACKQRRAGINSFGFGGSNAHVILEEYRPQFYEASRYSETNGVMPKQFSGELAGYRVPYLFLLSAHTKPALAQLVADYQTAIASGSIDESDLESLAYTLSVRRTHHDYRVAVAANSLAELASELAKAKIAKVTETARPKQMCFVFTGQGAQWHAMGRELLQVSDMYRETMERCDAISRKLVGWSVLEVLSADEATSQIGSSKFAQPCTAAVQLSLMNVWRSWGVLPSIVVGHSSGEIATAYAAGALTLEQAMTAAIYRGEAMSVAPEGAGKMAAVGITESEALALIASDQYKGRVSLAAVNSPGNVTLSGDADAIDAIAETCKANGTYCVVLRVNCAYHSHHMHPVGKLLGTYLQNLTAVESAVPMISTVTKTRLNGTEVDGAYWVRNLISTVNFCGGVEEVLRTQEVDAFVEVGPHPALAGPLRQILAAAGKQLPALPTIARKTEELRRMLMTVGALYELGFEVPFKKLFSHGGLKVVRNLPSFPWQHKSYWHESEVSRQARFRDAAHELLGHRINHVHGAWTNELRLDSVTYLRDHCIQGAVVFPGAGYIAMALAINRPASGEQAVLEDVAFKRALVFETEKPSVKTQLALQSAESKGAAAGYNIFSDDGSGGWQEHSSGRYSRQDAAAPEPAVAFEDIKRRCPTVVSKDDVYRSFTSSGLEYGPNFQGIAELYRGTDEAFAVVRAPACAVGNAAYLLHPTILDAAFQVLIGAIDSLNGSYLPVSIRKLTVLQPCTEPEYYVHARADKLTSASFTGDLTLYSASGLALVKVDGLQCNSIGSAKGSAGSDQPVWSDCLYETVWKPDYTALPAFGQVVAPHDAIPYDAELDRAAMAYMRAAVNHFAANAADDRVEQPQHQQLHKWAVENTASVTSTQVSAPSEESASDEQAVVHRIGSHLVDIWAGRVDALALLFGDDRIYKVYEKGTTFAPSNKVLVEAVSLLAHKNPSLRFLEIGAGTGGTTSYMLPALNGRFGSYTFTDVSSGFFGKAKAKFAAHAARMHFAVLDIERSPQEQGFEAGAYDIILATDVLHATQDIVRTLSNARGLLAPCGVILINEFINCPDWIQMVFGTLPGWWKFEDAHRRTVGPTLSEQGWLQSLGESGFIRAESLHDRSRNAIHATFVARVAEAPIPASSTTWLLLPDRRGVAQALKAELGTARIVNSAADIPTGGNAAVGGSNLAAANAVVYLPSLDAPEIFNGVTEANLAAWRHIVGRASLVVWVTYGAGNHDLTKPENSPLFGLVRVLQNEYPDCRCVVIDLDPAMSVPETSAALHKFLTSGDLTETEVSIRAGKVAVPRYARVTPGGLQARANLPVEKASSDKSSVRLEVGQPGLLNTLRWVKSARRSPGRGEVELAVHAVGMNFKDIMLAMGMLGEEAVVGGFCAANLGIECSGVVTAVGPDVTSVKPGDKVVAVACNSYSTYATTLEQLVVPIPAGLTFEDAATIPATFLTAHYAINHLARLEQGESILIHAAAGGVGQAAIQLALLRGAEVFATVGSADKRAFVESLGVASDHIFSSRTLDFADEIMKKTNGRGVDVVLNSLAGEALRRSVACLAPFGRFLEIGKRDIYANNKLDMLPFGQNVSFFGIDLDRLNQHNPVMSGRMFRQLMQLFAEGRLKPLAHKVYGFSKVEEAFRYIQQGKHIGKVILSQQAGENIEVYDGKLSFDPARVYLLIGGLGGFGKAVAAWLVGRGARKLAFISRSGSSSPAAAATRAELLALASDVAVAVRSADTADATQMASALASIKAELAAPLAGVVQAAMVLQDASFGAMTADQFNKATSPKIAGSRVLADFVAGEPLDFLLFFSSISGVIGNAGQANYAAGNAYQDALAHVLRARGVPATSINWGAIGDVGYLADHKELAASMTRRGFPPLPLAEVFKVLEWALASKPVQVGASPIVWQTAIRTVPIFGSPKFASLLRADEAGVGGASAASADGDGSGSVSIAQQLAAAAAEERPTVLRQGLRKRLGAMLGVPTEDVESSRKLSDMGVDSLMAVEVKNWIEKELNAPVSVLDITGGKSIDDLTVKILGSAKPPATAASAPAGAASPGAAAASSVSLLVPLRRVPKPSARLVTFPYLGGSVETYKRWPSLLKASVEVWSVQMPPISDWDQLVQALAVQIAEASSSDKSVPLVFYGHSLGALIAFEVARQLRSTAPDVTVSTLVVGAAGTPGASKHLGAAFADWSDAAIYAVPRDEFARRCVEAGLIENTQLDVDVLRAEILLGKRYFHWHSSQSKGPKFPGTLIAVHGTKDDVLHREVNVQDWQAYTEGPFEFHSLEGGRHLFVDDKADAVLALLPV